MKSRLTIAIILISFSCSISAQEKSNKIKLEGFQFHVSNTLSPSIQYSPDDFLKLNPNATILPNNISTYEALSPYVPIENLSFQALQEFRIKKKDSTISTSIFRVGLEYSIASDFNAAIRKEEEFRLDSFGNSQFRSIVIDSNHRQFYTNYQTSKQLGLHFSYIFNSNLGEKINMYAGIGGRIGLTFARKSNLSEFSFISVDSLKIDSNGNNVSGNPQFFGEAGVNENFTNKNYLNAAVFVPLGFNYQISTDHPAWRRVFVGYEVRTTALFSNQAYFGKPSFFHIQHGVNLVYKFNG